MIRVLLSGLLFWWAWDERGATGTHVQGATGHVLHAVMRTQANPPLSAVSSPEGPPTDSRMISFQRDKLTDLRRSHVRQLLQLSEPAPFQLPPLPPLPPQPRKPPKGMKIARLDKVDNSANAPETVNPTINGSRLTELEVYMLEIIQREAASVNLTAEEKSRIRELEELLGSGSETTNGEISGDDSNSAGENGRLSEIDLGLDPLEDLQDGAPKNASGEVNAGASSAVEIDGLMELGDLLASAVGSPPTGREPGASSREEESYIDLNSGPFEGFFNSG